MESLVNCNRRGFLSSLGVAGAGVASGFFGPDAFGLAAGHGAPEYLLPAGLTYLNTASLGPASRKVLDATIEAWHELETNPVGESWGDGKVIVTTDYVRIRAAEFLGCNVDELLMTRNTTEGMNSVALGIRLNKGDRVLTTNQEHEGGANGWNYRARREGVIVDKVTIGFGDHDPRGIAQRFADAITKDTRVISVSHVLTSTGLRMPIAEIAALARSRGILCVVDGAQAVGGIPVDVKELGCHAYATSGHKWLLGPKGTGMLYISRDAKELIEPVQLVEGPRCSAGSIGMTALPLVVGLGAAIDAMGARGMGTVESHNLALRNHAYAELAKLPRVRIMSPPPGPQATALLAFALPDELESRSFQVKLRDKHKVVVKMAEKQWFNGLRISPHVFNTEEDIDRVLQALKAELG